MKYKTIAPLLVVLFLTSSLVTEGADVEYTNYALDTTITIDGNMDDWAGIESVDLTLKPALVENEGNTSISAKFYSTHDDTSIYFLVVVTDNYYFYNYATGLAHHYAPALAIAFQIDAAAKVAYMGGTDRDTVENQELATGEVDIMHWELDTEHNELAGGTKNTTTGAKFGDGLGNLDDEYAITKEARTDDNGVGAENSYLGAWSHTGGYAANGTAGDYIFEISRDITTGDEHDAQFAEGESLDVAVAYWTPNEHTDKQWTDAGHYVNYDNVIDMSLSALTEPATSDTASSDTASSDTGSTDDEDDSPGFGLFLGLSSIFVMSVIINKKRN